MPSTNPPDTVVENVLHSDEEALELDEIQGNVLVGFNTKYQKLLFLKVADSALEPFRAWLARIVPVVSSAQTMHQGGAHRAGLNIAFTYAALKRLTRNRELDLRRHDFDDRSFKRGMADRASELGDAPGDVANWRVGGPTTSVDCLLILAAADQEAIQRQTNELLGALPRGVSLVHSDDGRKLEENREHFGYRDGVSQPGVRGYVAAPSTPFTRRADPNKPNQGRPGQDLIWPGEFVFGYYGQGIHGEHTQGKVSAGPAWAKNGSFVVYRRLEQRVAAFHTFVKQEAEKRAMDMGRFAAKLVGRWRSGAPMMQAPAKDARDLAMHNDFGFKADAQGDTCPFSAHIRKVYARDDRPAAEGRSRRLLRRGIPFGDDSSSSFARPIDDQKSRGLLFLAYQTSFERQFDAITRQANNPDFAHAGAGHDPLIGQSSANGGERSFRVEDDPTKPPCAARDAWVLPTGGEYLFAPSLSVLELLSKPKPNPKGVPAMTPKDNEVGSFLAFLYHIRFDPECRQRFTWPPNYDRTTGKIPPRDGDGSLHEYEKVMEEYKLTPAQRDLMVAVDWAMGSDDPKQRVRADELWEKLVEQLLPEFRAWTEGGVGYYGGIGKPKDGKGPEWW